MNKLVQELLDAASVVVGNTVKTCPNSMAVPDDIVGLCLAITHVEDSKKEDSTSGLMEVVDDLLKFIEDNDIYDEVVDDGDGFVDTWKSGEFTNLLDNTLKEINKLKEVAS